MSPLLSVRAGLRAAALLALALSSSISAAQEGGAAPAGVPAEPPPEQGGAPTRTEPAPGEPTPPAPGAPTVEALTPPGGGGEAGGQAPPPVGDGAAAGGPVTDVAPLTVSAAPTTGTNVAAEPFADDAAAEGMNPLVWVGVGGVLLTAAIGVAVWGRKPAARSAVAIQARERLQPLPEAGLVHPGLPSPSDGIAAWVAPEDLHAALAAALLDALANRRRVLIVAPAAVQLPLVTGGPVFRVEGLRPAQLGAAAAALRAAGADRVSALIVGVAPHDVAALADAMPSGCGGVALVSAPPPGGAPVVTVTVEDGDRLVLQHAAVRVRAALRGGSLQVQLA